MKKLLGLVTSLGLVATGSTALVSCSTETKAEDSIENQIRKLEYRSNDISDRLGEISVEIGSLVDKQEKLDHEENEIRKIILLKEKNIQWNYEMQIRYAEIIKNNEIEIDVLNHIGTLQQEKENLEYTLSLKQKNVDYLVDLYAEKTKELDEWKLKRERAQEWSQNELDPDELKKSYKAYMEANEMIDIISDKLDQININKLNSEIEANKVKRHILAKKTEIKKACTKDGKKIVTDPDNWESRLGKVVKDTKAYKGELKKIDDFLKNGLENAKLEIIGLQRDIRIRKKAFAQTGLEILNKQEEFYSLQDEIGQVKTKIVKLTNQQKSYE